MQQNDLLKMYGLDNYINTKKVKMVRHQDNSLNFEKLLKSNLLEEYQKYQSKDVFRECDYILVYTAFGKTHSLFYGIYRIKGKEYSENIKVSKALQSCNHPNNFKGFIYDLEEVHFLDDLKNRLVIDWGKSTITWDQWLNKNNKDVVSIRPKGYVKDFTGYLDVVLSFLELENIIKYKEANQTWFNKLSSIYAIYLILDTKTGNQYIGSASGKEGLWGRWKNYVDSIHGGNNSLRELIEKNGDHYKYKFQYSILHILSATKASKVQYYEKLYKKKLGSKTFGLNQN